MAVVGLGQLGGIADGIAFALQKGRRGKQRRSGKKIIKYSTRQLPAPSIHMQGLKNSSQQLVTAPC